MTKRIRDLMAQAGFDPAAIERMGVMPQAEKFTQLLVKECAATIRTELQRYPKDDLSWRSGMEESALVVERHFGVNK